MSDVANAEPEGYQRLSVNINTHSAAILREVTRDRDINVTEAIRIAIGLLGYMEAARRMVHKDIAEEQS